MTKHKKYHLFILVYLLLLYAFPINAEDKNDLQIGFKGGLNYTIPIYSMHNLTQEPKIHCQPKYQYGLFSEIPFNRIFSITVEILYEKRFVYMSKIINYGPEIYPYKFKVNYSLISLPILLKMKPKLLHRLYFSVGVRFEKMFDAVEDFADIGGFYRHKDVSDKMPNLNYGIDVGIGNEIPLQKIIIIPEVRYVFEMRPFSYDKYSYPVIKDDFTNHTILFNIGIARKISWHFSG